MTLLQLKTALASYHHKGLSDLVVNGIDLGLQALNQVRLQAELDHDFGFNRKLLTLNVDTVTGGSLANAVIQGTATTVTIKTVKDIGTLDDLGNFIPQEWTTVGEGSERQREENPFRDLRFRNNDDNCGPWGQKRFTLSDTDLAIWPKDTVSQTLSVVIDADVFSSDWEGNQTIDVTGVTGVTAFNTTYYLVGYFSGRGLWINADPLLGTASGILKAIWYDGTQWLLSFAADVGGIPTNGATSASTATTPAGLTFIPSGTLSGTPVTSTITSILTSANDIWTTRGAQYLQWAAIDQLNYYFKTYVQRAEGNLASPTTLAQAGLESLKDWDIFKYEGARRHGR